MSNTRTQGSRLVQSLTNFTLDTKPYHSKLTEVSIEFRFDETMSVSIEDAVASQMVTKAGWLYDFVSGGPGSFRGLPLQRLVRPDVLRPIGEVSEDLLGVPGVYAKKSTLGYDEVWREGATRDALVRGHDYFHCYGAAVLRVTPAPANDPDQSRRWQPTNAEGVLSTVTVATQVAALDTTNPSSANRRLRALLVQVQDQLGLTPNAAATTEVNALLTILGTPDLPRSYEALLTALVSGGTPVVSGFTGWVGEDGTPPGSRYFDDALSQLTPPAYFSVFSDGRLREPGAASYPNGAVGEGFTVTGVEVLDLERPEEWRLEVVAVGPTILSVTGSSRGVIGTVVVGSRFTSPFIAFDTAVTGSSTIGASTLLTPVSRLTVGASSPTQVWSLIRTDPLAYTRPVFTSPALGSIQDLGGVSHRVTLLDPALPTGTVTLTATAPTSFALTSDVEPGYTGTVTVGVPFNDGRLGLQVNAGSSPYQVGDRYLINVVNAPATTSPPDIYFGYDLDSLDNQTSVYSTDPADPTFNRPLEFRYDTRFVDFDPASLGLVVGETAVDGRRFRLTARPDGAPLATLKKDGTTVSSAIDLTDPTSGIPPDPGLTSVPVFSMPGDPNPAPDLLVHLASTCRLEWSDDNFTTTTFVADLPIGSTFTDPTLGISFTVPTLARPLIGVTSDDGLGVPRVEGGDVITWRVVNEAPRLEPSTVSLVTPRGATILMHGDGFWDAPDAAWQVVFTSPTTYEVRATHATGPAAGSSLPGYPTTGTLTTTGTGTYQGATYQDDLVHFTLRPGTTPFVAGAAFTFTTTARKPSILVHGSASGWMPDVVIGEWTWNGHIGFKVDAPTATIFQGTGTSTAPLQPTDPDFTRVAVTRVRPDTPNLTYTFTNLGGSYLVERSDAGVSGHAALTGTFRDRYLTVTTDGAASFRVQVRADPLTFWDGEDCVVVRPGITALTLQPGDTLSVRKAETGTLAISLDYQQVPTPPSLSPLYPLGINDDFIDLDTGSSPPIETHSPEAVIFDGWLPLTIDGFDATGSIASFPDAATTLTVRSAATNQPIGTLSSLGSLNEPIRFEWDETFHTTYLPLGARASLVTYGTGLDDKVRVRIHERVNFLIAGGVLLEDALFTDAVTTSIAEEWGWLLTMRQEDAVTATIEDGPFGGFLPGYANLPYDAEDALGLDLTSLAAAEGRYDTGAPLVDHYLRAQHLSTLPSPTPDETRELTDLTGLLAAYLQPGGLAATTLPQVLAALDADPFTTSTVAPEMGRPARGHAIDIDQRSTDTTTTTFSGAVSIHLSAAPDQPASVVLVAPAVPPMPTPTYTTYAALDTPLVTTLPARSFILTFPAPVTATPTVTVWVSTDPSPFVVPVVERVTSRSFTFNLATDAIIKVVVT